MDLPRERAQRYKVTVRLRPTWLSRRLLRARGPLRSALLAAAALPAVAAAQSDLGARLDLHLQGLVPWGFSGSLLVARSGRVVLATGYGMADRGRGIANTAQTLFPLAGLGQQFTAVAVLLLVDQGRLGLEDSLGARLDGVPADKAGITLRQLLDHRGGLALDVGDPFGPPESKEDALARILASPLSFPPGAQAAESNAGYALLAAVVEKTAAQPFEEFLRAQVLDRAGLTSCWFAGDARSQRAPLARAWTAEEEGPSPATWVPSWPLYGRGALLASVGDLYRWERALAPDVLLSPAALEVLTEPKSGPWAGGLRIERGEGGRRVAQRSSTLAGFQVELRRGLDDGLTWALLLNEPMPAAVQHVDLLLSGRSVAPPPEVGELDPRQAAAAAGTYELPGGGRLRVGFDQGRLSIAAENQGGIDALASAGPEDQNWSVEYGNRTLALCESLRGRDFPAAAALLSRTAQDVDGWLGGWWRKLEERLGDGSAPRVVACLPREQAVVLRLEFERGSEIVWFTWEGRTLREFQTGPTSFHEGRLWPSKQGGLVTYDPRTFTARQLALMLRADGSVRGLSFPGDQGDAGQLGARRID